MCTTFNQNVLSLAEVVSAHVILSEEMRTTSHLMMELMLVNQKNPTSIKKEKEKTPDEVRQLHKNTKKNCSPPKKLLKCDAMPTTWTMRLESTQVFKVVECARASIQTRLPQPQFEMHRKTTEKMLYRNLDPYEKTEMVAFFRGNIRLSAVHKIHVRAPPSKLTLAPCRKKNFVA